MGGPSNTDRAPGEGFLVLWTGGSAIAERDAQVELRRIDGIRVESCAIAELIQCANERAPDLIVLGGEAGEAPEPHVARIGATSPASAIPVVALAPTGGAPPKIRARYGLVARVDRDADAPAIAALVGELVRTLAARAPVWKVESKSGDMEEAATRFAVAARCGLVAADGGGTIAVDAAGTIAKGPDRLYGDVFFYERPPGRVVIATQAKSLDEPAAALEGMRALVIDDDPERRDRIAKRLERSSAQTRATGAISQAVHASRALDPTLIVIAAPALSSSALGPLLSEPRLASASVLVLDGEALANAALAPWIGIAATLCRPEVTLRRRLRNKEALADRLETLGAARWLKLLGRCDHEVTLRVYGSAGRARVDLDGGRIQGAAMRPLKADGSTSTEVLEGRAAVDALMSMMFGRVLAGPPGALAALDGSRAGRKPSAVGQLERAAPSGVRRGRGLVAEEVVVKTTDATSMRPPSLAARGELRPITTPRISQPIEPPVEAKPPPPEDDEPEITAEVEKRASSIAMGIASSPPPRKKPSSIAPPMRKIESERPPPLEVVERRIEVRPVETPPVELPPIETPPAQLAPAKVKKSGNGVWLTAGLMLALGVGGWAAWRLYLEERGAPAARVEPRPAARDPVVSAPPEPEPEAEPERVPSPQLPPAEREEERAESPSPAAREEESAEPPGPAAREGESVETLLARSHEAATARDFAESEALARRALEGSPQNPEAAYRLAVALYRQNRGQEAVEWAQRSAEWEPDEARALSLAGDIYTRIGQFMSAARAYDAALQREPRYGPAERGLENLARRGITP